MKVSEKVQKGRANVQNFSAQEKRAGYDTVLDGNDAEAAGLKGDYCNLLLLLLLYFLQGIPLGLIEAIPLILAHKKVSYEHQAIFSVVYWPLALKLLWAPLVDSIYSKRFGRRKSWFVPVQYAIGALMLGLSHRLRSESDGKQPDMLFLTISFLVLIVLTATQDIVTDGWALTMLSKHNIHYAPSCNFVGNVLGDICANGLFLALESPKFCNRWLRTEPSDVGIVSLAGFLLFWAIVFIVVTTLIMLFKNEIGPSLEGEKKEEELGLFETYKMLWNLLRLPTVRWSALILLTWTLPFGPSDRLSDIKLVEYGYERENIGLMKIPLLPLHVLLPWIVSRLSKNSPMRTFFRFYPFKVFGLLIYSVVIWQISAISREKAEGLPATFYALLASAVAIDTIGDYGCGVSLSAFSAKISDPLIGGTYMTLLSTLLNLGVGCCKTISLYVVNLLDFDWCPNSGFICKPTNEVWNSTQYSADDDLLVTTEAPRVNSTLNHLTNTTSNLFYVDGYFALTVLCFSLSIIWIASLAKKINWLEKCPLSEWRSSREVTRTRKLKAFCTKL